MYLTGDYVNLVDPNGDYLDKPHLLFWLAAFSYKIFGVTSLAYKIPSFLFTILGVYSGYRLARTTYNNEVGKLTALILATGFAFMLANNDVRMEAMLTASIAFASWQLVEFIQTKKLLNVAAAALGLALGFSTKGMIGVFVPLIGAFFYILYGKDYKIFYNWKWLLMLVLFGIFISPVLYCYYLQFNLHPEKIVRGKDHINGIKFILFNQSIERYGGQVGAVSKQDHFFFLHSFLWAFAPWSILVYLSLVRRIKMFGKCEMEWLSTSTFIIILLIVSFSGFKLPHYLNIIFPVSAVMAAVLIISSQSPGKWIRPVFIIQTIVSVLILFVIALINAWAFPIHSIWIIALIVLLLALVFYFARSSAYSVLQKSALIPVSVMILSFFLLNTNFYPQLLKYQGGNELAFTTRGKVNYDDVYFWKETQSSSFNFYTETLRKQFSDSVLKNGKKVWLLYDIKDETEIKQSYKIGQRFETPDYEITKLDLKFIDPERRTSKCTKMILGELDRL